MKELAKWYVVESGDWGYGCETYRTPFDTYAEAKKYYDENAQARNLYRIEIIDGLAEAKAELAKLEKEISELKEAIKKIE